MCAYDFLLNARLLSSPLPFSSPLHVPVCIPAQITHTLTHGYTRTHTQNDHRTHRSLVIFNRPRAPPSLSFLSSSRLLSLSHLHSESRVADVSSFFTRVSPLLSPTTTLRYARFPLSLSPFSLSFSLSSPFTLSVTTYAAVRVRKLSSVLLAE